MLQLYFQNEDPSFDLLFDSPEEGQTYVDRYKESILADGSKVLAERDKLRTAATVFYECH